MENDKGEKIIPVGDSFREIENGRTRLKVVFHGGRSCAGGGDEDEGLGVSDSLVTLLFSLDDIGYLLDFEAL